MVVIIYLVLGYWAVGATIYANKIRIGGATELFISRLTIGLFFGWLLIPIALLKSIFFRS